MTEFFSGVAIGAASPAGLIFTSLVLLAVGLLIAQGVNAMARRMAECDAGRAAAAAANVEATPAKTDDYRRAA